MTTHITLTNNGARFLEDLLSEALGTGALDGADEPEAREILGEIRDPSANAEACSQPALSPIEQQSLAG